MDYIWEGAEHALAMILALDPDLRAACLVSLKVSGIATVLACCVGLPVGYVAGTKRFWGRGVVRIILQTLLAMPTVLIGLLLFSLLSRRGPFGSFRLLYTQGAMIIGQFVLAGPIVAALTMGVLEHADPRIALTATTLGATRWQTALTVLAENRAAILAAILAAFGRVFAEVGISMMLGGNIRWYTRNVTTTIALQSAKGEFALGIALGLILLVVALAVNIGLHTMRGKTD